MKKNGQWLIVAFTIVVLGAVACAPEAPPVEFAAMELKAPLPEPPEEEEMTKASVVVEGIDCKGAQPGDELDRKSVV